MTGFEQKGVDLQYDSSNYYQAQKRLSYSCNLCCTRGLRIKCESCAISAANKCMNSIFSIQRAEGCKKV